MSEIETVHAHRPVNVAQNLSPGRDTSSLQTLLPWALPPASLRRMKPRVETPFCHFLGNLSRDTQHHRSSSFCRKELFGSGYAPALGSCSVTINSCCFCYSAKAAHSLEGLPDQLYSVFYSGCRMCVLALALAF